MSYTNQVPNLPFRHDVAMSQLNQYRLDAPPCIPIVNNCPPQIQYLVPAICSTLANELAAKCNAHAGRMYLFNQLSANNFANNEFASAVNTVVDMLTLQLMKGVYRNAEEGLMQVVTDTLSILTSLLFQNVPALQSVTPPDVVFEANKNIQAYYSLSNEISSMKMRMTQPQGMGQFAPTQPMMQQPQQMMINPSFGMNPGMQSSFVQQPPMQSSFGGNQNMQRGINPGMQNTSIFNQGPQATIAQSTPISQNAGKYDYLKPKNVPAPVVVEPVRVSSNFNAPQKEVSTLKLSDWIPSSAQNYPPAINPFTSKLEIKEIIKGGVASKILKLIKLEESEMDRSKHVITSISQIYTSRIPNEYGTRQESLEDNVNKIFQIDEEKIIAFNSEDKDNVDTFEVLSYIDPTWVYENFIDAAIFSGKLQQKEHRWKDSDCSIFRVYKIIANPIICEEDHSSYINELSLCKSFKELSILLRETINDHLTSRSLIDLCYGIDKILTKEINNIVRNKMSIPNTTISSFIDDVNDIPDYLVKNFGDMYKRVFMDFQRTYISQLIGFPNLDAKEGDECIDEEAINPLVKVNYINHSYSITYLTVENQELGIEPYDNCGSAVLESEHPLMYKIITGIYNQDRDIDHDCLHNLIVTSDDVIYEVQKGLIGNDIFTINHWVK